MIQDLCIIMLTAGVTSLVLKLLKQPVVLGYIVAGMLVGHYMLGDSWVSDEASVETWGQIGVLFLLFAMGLEFSFKKLLEVGSTALIAAGTIVVGMMGAGFLVGRALGLDTMNSLFLGGMLCMSSTTIVFKALDDMGLRGAQFARICFGILVVEDLFAVVLMVLLSSIATSRSFEGERLLLEVAKLVGYLVLWFVMGIILLPTFFRKFKRHLTDETLTIFSVGLCLGMVLLAVSAGFSSALGAFVMGSLLAETLEAERIERLTEPVKNIFGSIFFVSVGMMIDPALLVHHWSPILIITLTVIIGQIVFATTGTLLSGQTLKVSVQTGFSLVQIGEFAFIIASLGQSLNVTDSSLYHIVVAVSVVTTFLTPFIIRTSQPVYDWIDSHLSDRVKDFLNNYSRISRSESHSSSFGRLLRKMLLTLLVCSILLVFIYLLFFNMVSPWLDEHLPTLIPDWLVRGAELFVLLVAVSPLIYAIAHAGGRSNETQELWQSGISQRVRLVILSILRILIAGAFAGYAILRLFSATTGIVAAVSILFVLTVMLSRRVRRQSHALQKRFSTNLSAREKSSEKHRSVSRRFEGSLLSYDIHLADLQLDATSTFCGRSLLQLNIREKSGVSVVRIVRGGINIDIPGGHTILYPGDRIIVAGSDEQIERFGQMLTSSLRTGNDDGGPSESRAQVTLQRLTIQAESPLLGVPLRNSGIRDKAHCLVIAIERDGQLITNPDPRLIFHEGDVVLVAGESERIAEIQQAH